MSGLSAASAVGFALICIFAGRLGIVARLDRQRWLSFAGGAATAYVFVHLLPELGAHRQTIDESAFAHGAYLYLVVLAGTCIYYGLETYIAHSETGRSAGFWVHMAGFSLYFALIGYFLMHRGDNDGVQEVFYFTVLGLHIFALDAEFRRHHPELYDKIGRWVMAASVLAGWGISASIELPAIVTGLAFALLAGGMILNVLKQELPTSREGQYLPFVTGAGICATLLFLA